jgi:predicted glycosyltransferase
MTGGRVLFHVQHLLGIGHVKRAAALARALAAGGFETIVLSGGEPVAGIDWGGAELAQLPSARALDASFKRLVDADGAPLDDAFRARRRARVLAEFARRRPHLVLLETFPFGRRAFRFELLPLLDAAASAAPRPAVAVSLRDIVVAKPDPGRVEEIVGLVRQRVDRVLVHGDPRLVPLEASFPAAVRFADRLRYTGYVADPAPPSAGEAGEGTGEIVVSVGGGAVGGRLLAAALAARPLSRAAASPWRLIAGPNLPEDTFASLRRSAPPGVALERFRADFRALLRRCAASISQAGYNTVLDVLAAGCPAVLVPFAAGAETEQTQRAALLARRGVVQLVPEAGLTPALLAAALDRALAGRPAAAVPLDLDGAARAAAAVGELVSAVTARSRNV